MSTQQTAKGFKRKFDGEILTVRIPIKFKRIGGRKVIIAPEGCTDWVTPPQKPDNTLLKALARAHRWHRLVESGQYQSFEELAKAEKINLSYVCRLVRLTLLAPDIVEAVLDGQQPKGMSVTHLVAMASIIWADQRDQLNH